MLNEQNKEKTELTEEAVAAINNAIFSGRKIEAIKIYRTASGKDLKSSKEYIDRLTDELKKSNPAMFVNRPSWKGNPATIIFWIVAAAAVIYLIIRNR